VISRVTKRFGPVRAVDGLSFTAAPGQVTGFLGPNGAGKTTTLRMLAGLGALLRSEVITVAGLLLYLYVAEPLVSHVTALGPWTAYLPGVAADGLTQASQAGVRLLPPWQGGLVFAAWAAALAAAGAVMTARQDIT